MGGQADGIQHKDTGRKGNKDLSLRTKRNDIARGPDAHLDAKKIAQLVVIGYSGVPEFVGFIGGHIYTGDRPRKRDLFFTTIEGRGIYIFLFWFVGSCPDVGLIFKSGGGGLSVFNGGRSVGKKKLRTAPEARAASQKKTWAFGSVAGPGAGCWTPTPLGCLESRVPFSENLHAY